VLYCNNNAKQHSGEKKKEKKKNFFFFFFFFFFFSRVFFQPAVATARPVSALSLALRSFSPVFRTATAAVSFLHILRSPHSLSQNCENVHVLRLWQCSLFPETQPNPTKKRREKKPEKKKRTIPIRIVLGEPILYPTNLSIKKKAEQKKSAAVDVQSGPSSRRISLLFIYFSSPTPVCRGNKAPGTPNPKL
jgi:hypothetical protein